MTDLAEATYKDCAVEFTGSKAGYFKLWFVNLLLSIVTLGIYSAWAKVRNNQYLYGHTQIDGHRLSYLAKPLQILRGRILAIVVFGGLYLIASFFPPLLALFFIGYIFVLPWAIGQGMKFTLRMTSYRNVRFSFTGSYGDLFIHFMLLPMVAMFTLYLTAPWIHKLISEFIHKNITYGGKPMKVDLSTGRFYFAAFCTIGSANHIRGVRSGTLTGTARAVHCGRSSQVWEIRIENSEGKLSCISRLTMAVVAAQSNS